MRCALILIAGVITAAGQQATSPPVTDARPIVEFEKTRFVVGERVFFWIGVEVPGQRTPVPAALWDTMRVVITRPDGTERIDKINWPIDGMGINGPGDLGWRGGHGLGAETPQIGRWVVLVEFAGKRSQPVTFTVDDIALLKEIDATFVFSLPLILDAPDATATLVVRNRSSDVIRFVELGQNNSNVSIRLTKTTGPAWSASFFVPYLLLSAVSGHAPVPMSVDKFTWAAVKDFPTVTVAPGAVFQLPVPVPGAMEGLKQGIPSGEYDVTFSAELQILAGEPEGRWKDFAPMRLVATSTTKATRR